MTGLGATSTQPKYQRLRLVAGACFYVDGRGGNDAYNGLSQSAAFRSIARAIGAGLAPGDTVRIKAGRYRERFSITRSGTAADRIVIGAFGDGPVVVDASLSISAWTLVSGQVYRASVPAAVTAVVVDDVPLFPEFSQAALKEGRWYYDGASKQLFVWCPQGGSPASHDVGVVQDDAYKDAIVLQNASFVTLYGLTVRFAGGHGVSILGDYVRVEKCRLRFNGKAGVSSFRWGTTTSTHLEIVKNEVYHNVLRNWPRGRIKWGGWAPGVASNSTPDVLYEGNVVYRNSGEGLLAYGGSGGVIRDNVSYDNWSVNIYVDNRPNVVVENNFVYNHNPDPADLYNNGDPAPGDNRNLSRLRPEGIMTADENYNLNPPANLANITIANNVIVNCRRGITHYAQATGSGLKNVKVVHNTVVVPTSPVGGESTLVGIVIPYNAGNNVGSVYRNNIVYASHPATLLLDQSNSPVFGDGFKGLSIDHNLWFHASRPKPFHWGPGWLPATNYDLAAWQALAGTPHGAGDAFADPRFVDVLSIDNVSAKRLLAGSPAGGIGAALGVAEDYGYCVRSATAPTLGAFEGSSAGKPVGGLGDAANQVQKTRNETAAKVEETRVFTNADLSEASASAPQASAPAGTGNSAAPTVPQTARDTTGSGVQRGGAPSSGLGAAQAPAAGGGPSVSPGGAGGSAVGTPAPRSASGQDQDRGGGASGRVAAKTAGVTPPRVFTNEDLLLGREPSPSDNNSRGTISFPGDSAAALAADAATPLLPAAKPAPMPTPAPTPKPNRKVAVAPRYFSAAGPWDWDVSAAPLDRESPTVVSYLRRVGWGTGKMLVDFGMEVVTATATTPRMPFTSTSPQLPDCDYVPVPVPVGGAVEGEAGYACTKDGQCRLIVADWQRQRLFELWRADIRDGAFKGGCLAAWDMSRSYPASGRGEQCRSADAAGFPVAALVFTADEVAAGGIGHAIRFTLPNDRIRRAAYVRPASSGVGAAGPADAPPYGTRLRLRSTYPIASLPPGAQVVARAMQQFGMLLADAGDVALTAQSDRFTVAKWSGLLGANDLSSLRPEDFEMVAAGPRYAATGSCARNP